MSDNGRHPGGFYFVLVCLKKGVEKVQSVRGETDLIGCGETFVGIFS